MTNPHPLGTPEWVAHHNAVRAATRHERNKNTYSVRPAIYGPNDGPGAGMLFRRERGGTTERIPGVSLVGVTELHGVVDLDRIQTELQREAAEAAETLPKKAPDTRFFENMKIAKNQS